MKIDDHVDEILKLLVFNKNVILLGPPAVGKSKIMSKVASKFKGSPIASISPSSNVPIPRSKNIAVLDWLPSPLRTNNRECYKITFHQGTKHRDFIGGILPRLTEGQTGFTSSMGLLLKANFNAIKTKGASLVIIDEINRGPAISIFGDTLSAIELDKRLDKDDALKEDSIPFQAFSEESGKLEDNYLSEHVYLLCSMNEADTSVEPLDVAFLRRFEPYRIEPDINVLYEHFNINEATVTPNEATSKEEIFSALIKAWQIVNKKIAIGRGDAFQIGHGILLYNKIPLTLDESKQFASACWRRIESHIREVFFSNDIAQSIIFNSSVNIFYRLEEKNFGEQSISKMVFATWNNDDIYKLLQLVSTSDDN